MKASAWGLLGLGIILGYSAPYWLGGAAQAAAPGAKAACPWGSELDAVRAAPDNHKVLLENDRVRVLDVTVLPGQREPLHAHCNASVLYVMQRGALRERNGEGRIVRDEAAAPATLPITQWHATEPPHSVENPGTVPIRILRVELKE